VEVFLLVTLHPVEELRRALDRAPADSVTHRLNQVNVRRRGAGPPGCFGIADAADLLRTVPLIREAIAAFGIPYLRGLASPQAMRRLLERQLAEGWCLGEEDAFTLLALHALAGEDGPIAARAPVLLARLEKPRTGAQRKKLRERFARWTAGLIPRAKAAARRTGHHA
jgi:hypothetical protein